jgi:tetratricopeptide (TPR) repeat protein
MAQKRDPHDSLFRAAQTAEHAFGRRKAAELRQNARSAQQRKDWAQAESLWRRSLEEDAGDRMATAGLAQVLVYNGKLDEAQRFADELVAKWPEDENGPTVLARIAEERGDTAEAIAQWQRVLTLAAGRSQALIRLGRLMVAQGSLDEAKAYADQLALYAPDNPNAISLLAEIDTARGDLASAAARRKAVAEKFPQQAQLWHEYGLSLIALGDYATCEALVARLANTDPQNAIRLEGLLLAARDPEAGHSGFWRRAHESFPQNADFLRKYLHAVLRDGKRDEAERVLEEVLKGRLLRANDMNFILGMINLLGGDDARAQAKTLLRRFLKRFREMPDYRRIGLRLSRVIFEDCPKVERPFDATGRTLGMLARTPAEPAARDFVEYAARTLSGFDRGLFDTDISRAQSRDVVARLRAALAEQKPFSFIRVGDGESNALAYDTDIARFADSDAAEREMVWWGRALDPSQRQALSVRVLTAMQDADGLGIPALERILRDIKLERREFLGSTRAGRGLRMVLRALEDGGALAQKRALMVSAHLQHDLEKWNLYGDLFGGVDGIVALSCHDGLPDVFAKRFGRNLAQNIVVPPRHASLGSFGMTQMGPKILPEVLDDTIAQLDANLSGCMVIVGAGYAGKVIVHEAKKRGAVALDLGSVLDYWMGAATRSYLTAGAAAA